MLLDSITLALKLGFFTQTVRISTNLGKALFMQRKKKKNSTDNYGCFCSPYIVQFLYLPRF